MDEREFLLSPPSDRAAFMRLRSVVIVALGALLFLLEGALILNWLDPAALAHALSAPHNRFARYGVLSGIVILSALFACGSQLELSAPRTRFEHVVNVLALPFFAAFCDTLLLAAFADPALPNARIGACAVIALCFANLSMVFYIWGLWQAMGRPYHPRSALALAHEAAEPGAFGSTRPSRLVWWNPPGESRSVGPIAQVLLLGLPLALAVAQVIIIAVVQSPQVSESWFLNGLAASFVSFVVALSLFFFAYQRAAPIRPRLRRL